MTSCCVHHRSRLTHYTTRGCSLTRFVSPSHTRATDPTTHAALLDDARHEQAAGNEAACIVLFLYCFVFFWFVAGLACFHTFLISKGRTTYENFKFKGPHDGDESPRGGVTRCLQHWERFCFVGTPPSRLQLRSHLRSPQRALPTTTPLIRTTNGSASPATAVATGRRASVSIIPPQKQLQQQTAPAAPSSSATMTLSPPVANGSLRGRSRRLTSPSSLAAVVLGNTGTSPVSGGARGGAARGEDAWHPELEDDDEEDEDDQDHEDEDDNDDGIEEDGDGDDRGGVDEREEEDDDEHDGGEKGTPDTTNNNSSSFVSCEDDTADAAAENDESSQVDNGWGATSSQRQDRGSRDSRGRNG